MKFCFKNASSVIFFALRWRLVDFSATASSPSYELILFVVTNGIGSDLPTLLKCPFFHNFLCVSFFQGYFCSGVQSFRPHLLHARLFSVCLVVFLHTRCNSFVIFFCFVFIVSLLGIRYFLQKSKKTLEKFGQPTLVFCSIMNLLPFRNNLL